MTRAHPDQNRSISRAILVLKTLATHKQLGWRLSDLASACSLDVATTYRILRTLTAERLVYQRADDRRYVAGAVMFELSLAIPSLHSFKNSVKPELDAIASDHHGISFLHLRSGTESVCIEKVGNSTVHAITDIGSRRHLARSTSGIAMLLKLPKEEQAALLKDAQKKSSDKKRDLSYRVILQTSRQHGYGLNEGKVVPGLPSVDFALVDSKNRPVGSIGLMGPTSIIAGAKLQRVAHRLKDTANAISLQYGDVLSSLIY